MYQQTTHQRTHGQIILEAIKGGWRHSADLVAMTGTRNLQARITGLEGKGWVIDRRPSTDKRDGVEYRVTRFDSSLVDNGPKAIHVKVPKGCPAEAIAQAKAEAARIMQEAVEAADEDRAIDLADFFNLFGE